ncbi:MAG: NifB/NifX family molybdenum-iron cluster-binding protein [Firmicutes bacterium]|nr:NifB/NifX family molybdenum-iron cluster-binding protein [Bacillota bacterium]
MKVAIPFFAQYIAPRFDCADRFLIVDIVNGEIKHQDIWECRDSSPLIRTQALADLAVDVLICGAIDNCSFRLLSASGKQVVSWQSGQVDEVLARLLSGEICGAGCGFRRTRAGPRCGAGNTRCCQQHGTKKRKEGGV